MFLVCATGGLDDGQKRTCRKGRLDEACFDDPSDDLESLSGFFLISESKTWQAAQTSASRDALFCMRAHGPRCPRPRDSV